MLYWYSKDNKGKHIVNHNDMSLVFFSNLSKL